MCFIRVWLMSSILVTPDFEHTIKRYPVSWYSWTLVIIRASWPTEKKLRPSSSNQSLCQAPGFLDRGPWPVVPSCRGGLQKGPITQSKTKFDHIVQKLPQKIMVGLIMGSAASSETPYEDLKAKLVSLYTLSRWQKVSKLIHHPGLGDRRPTALMDTMLALLPEDKKPGCLFLGLFLERLPVEMRDHVVSREFKNPSEIALYADSLWDARKAIPTDHLLAAASISLSPPSRGRTQDCRSPSPNRRSQTPGPSKSECWFHQSFGPAANNCRPPCSFQGNARAGG